MARYVGPKCKLARREGTSGLSPHLRFGEISPFQIWHAARFAAEKDHRVANDIDKFLSELGSPGFYQERSRFFRGPLSPAAKFCFMSGPSPLPRWSSSLPAV